VSGKIYQRGVLKRSAIIFNLHEHPGILAVFVVLIALLYGMNAFGNLRLNTDVVALLSSAISRAQGIGQIFHGRPTVFPPGYPFIVELQLRMGIASSYSLILFNWMLLLVGIGSFVLLLRTSFGFSWALSLVFAIFVMLNWAIVKHAPLSTTDIPYFGISLLSLLIIERARIAKDDPTAISMFLFAFALVAASIGIRRVGVALLPVWVAALATRPGWFQRLIAAPRLMQIIPVVVVLAGMVVLLVWFLSTVTLRDYPESSTNALFARVIMSIEQRAREVGEVILNLPWRRIPSRTGGIFMIIGGIVVALALTGLVRRRRVGVVEVYCLAYAAIILAWWAPVGEPRLIIPIIPFLFVYAFLGTASIDLARWENGLLVVWAIVYAAGGIAALYYSARLTSAAEQFPALYGSGYYRATYCHFLKACPLDDARALDFDALRVLETFQGKSND
jgi:hypothetical protein